MNMHEAGETIIRMLNLRHFFNNDVIILWFCCLI